MEYTVGRIFPLLKFLQHQVISLKKLISAFIFTNDFIVVSFEDIVSKSAFGNMKLAYPDLKLANVLQSFFIRKPILFLWASILLT